MARQEQPARQKQRVDYHARQVRRGQIAFAFLSVIIILSMLISLIRW